MSFTISKDSKFFIMVEKGEGIHNSLSTGYIDSEGSPQLLTRVGKTNDIEKNTSGVALFFQEVLPGLTTKARLAGEDLSNTKNEQVSYQAYEISLKQYREFLSLCANLYQEQVEYYGLVEEVKKEKYTGTNYGERRMVQHGIKGNVPIKETDNDITFNMQRLNIETDYQLLTVDPDSNDFEVIPDAIVKLQTVAKNSYDVVITNTCRTTARDIINAIANVGNQIGSWFASNLDYSITIDGNGDFPCEAFYILPPPPASSENYDNKETKQILNKLYEKLRQIPKNNPESINTRAKFEALSKLYKEIAGNSKNITITQLFDIIQKSQIENKKVIECFRNYGWGNSFFNSETSTQKLYKTLLNEVESRSLRT